MNEQVALSLREQMRILSLWFTVLWGLFIAERLFHFPLSKIFGIKPRHPLGLIGIPLSPLFHGNLGHLTANSVPLFFLAWLTMLTDRFWLVSGVIILVGGTGIWLIGRHKTNHIGASSLIYGYLGYLVLYGLRMGEQQLFIAALLLAWVYRYAVYGLHPRMKEQQLSWEGHLFGLIGGIAAAWWLT
ncbi:MAG: rhomboid family intramembrane serine protease [Chloroflexi bacterium]|nr:rhomboid family intramembrane serine protease [Chloroflexota bacterium]MBP8056103.1 rhomboid family intramembrane serine protease [Chloroflexota bacterium]